MFCWVGELFLIVLMFAEGYCTYSFHPLLTGSGHEKKASIAEYLYTPNVASELWAQFQQRASDIVDDLGASSFPDR